MNKHAMYMVLCIDKNTMQYYSMLYYALETWEKYYNGGYDVFISVSARDFDFWNDEYLGLNLLKRFPNVNFYKSDFDKSKYNVYVHKWYDMDKVFSKGYESIFLFDIDSIFYKDISYIFEKYNEDYFYGLSEGYNEHFFKVLGENGRPSGQCIIPRTVFDKVGKDLFKKILDKRIELIEKAHNVLDDGNYRWFKALSEQYAAQKVFSENGVEFGMLHQIDIGMGVEDFNIECRDGKVVTSLKNNRGAAGYMSGNYHLFLPEEYLEEYDLQRRNKYCYDRSSKK